MPHGKGAMKYKEGDVYEGEFKDEKKHGQGKYSWSNGTKYEAQYKNDLVDGKGTLIHNDGTKSVGEFKDGNLWNGKYFDEFGYISGKIVNGEEEL